MAQVSVIIVSYNVRHYLAQCLESVRRASASVETEVIVIDNESSDGSLEYLEPLFPEVRFMPAGGNLGFAKANNRALELATGKYVLFLNPDTVISENVLVECVSFMDAHPEAGMTGVKMLNADGSFARESRRAVPTPWVSFCKMFGLTALMPHSKLFGKYYLGYLPREKAARIEVVSGAFMFARREAVTALGGFDEAYFMYGEDVDLSYRILKAGWQNWYLPVTILHYKGESTNRTSYRYAKVFYGAMSIFFDRHFNKYSKLFSLAVKAVTGFKAMTSYLAANLIYRGKMETDAQDRWLYVGPGDVPEAISARVEAKCDSPDKVQEAIRNAETGHVIFDADAFKWSRILACLASQKGHTRFKLGTFSAGTGMVLTEKEQIKV